MIRKLKGWLWELEVAVNRKLWELKDKGWFK